MKQPYTYSMPESFIKDKSVPARWRVLGVINGFILNGGCFYGSNEWLMEQLGCTEPTITAAFAELEALNLVEIHRTARTRKVYRKAHDPNKLGSETQTEPVHDPSQLGPNSVKNSVKEYGAVANAPREEFVLEEETTRSKKPPKYQHAKEVFSWFPKPEPSWKLNTTELKHAELLFLRGEETVKQALRYCEKHKNDEHFYQITKPSDLERKWEDIRAYAERTR